MKLLYYPPLSDFWKWNVETTLSNPDDQPAAPDDEDLEPPQPSAALSSARLPRNNFAAVPSSVFDKQDRPFLYFADPFISLT